MSQRFVRLIEALSDYLDEARGAEAEAVRGYRLVCQAPGHGDPRTYVGECRRTQAEARDDMQAHADEFHGGSTAGMTYSGRCDLENARGGDPVGYAAKGPPRTVKDLTLDETFVIDAAEPAFAVRALTKRERGWLSDRLKRTQEVQDAFHALKPFGGVLYGTCVNDSDEPLAVYGPKLEGETYDNSLYVLPRGRRTPRFWDCDGLFVPNDRRYPVGVARYETGPLAVKVSDLAAMTVVTSRPNTYSASSDRGVLQLLRPGQVNWSMPNVGYRRIIESLPDVE